MGVNFMSLFGVPSACARCGKKVYAAEQKLAEEKNWHSICWSLEFKEREAQKKHNKDVTSYNKPADIQPEYYRVADPATGSPSTMESGASARGGNTSSVEGGAKFCSGCGKARTAADRFCSGRGSKLE